MAPPRGCETGLLNKFQYSVSTPINDHIKMDFVIQVATCTHSMEKIMREEKRLTVRSWGVSMMFHFQKLARYFAWMDELLRPWFALPACL